MYNAVPFIFDHGHTAESTTLWDIIKEKITFKKVKFIAGLLC